MRFRPWVAVVLIASILLCGCAGNQEVTEPTTMAATEATIVEPETVDTEPTTLPPARPPEEVLPEIETLVADTPNARVYIDNGTLCVETSDETTTGTGSVAYDRFDGAADAWQKVIDNSVALCLLMRTKMDDEGAYATPVKVTVLDHRFDSRAILTIVDGEVVEDTVAIELANIPQNRPITENEFNSGSQPETTTYILNTGSKRFHLPGCASVKQMKESNKQTFRGSRNDAISMGYEPCGNCNP